MMMVRLSGLWLGLLPSLVAAAPPSVVIVTVRPMAAVVRDICGPDCDVQAVVPQGQSEHTWEPSVRDIMRLSSADVAIGIGLDFDEHWLKSIPFTKKITPAYVGKLMDPQLSVGGDDHDNDAHHDGHHHGVHDPHVWFDPLRVAKTVDFLVAELTKVRPEAKERLHQRGSVVNKGLLALDAEIKQKSSFWTTGTVIVFHDNLRYFSQAYHIRVESAVAGATGHETSAKVLGSLAKKYKGANKPKLILTEREDGAARNLARELGVPVAVADFSAISDTMSYSDWLRSLVQVFDQSLKP